MSDIPIIAVGALIFNPKGEVFLMSAPSWNGRYIIPGGHVEHLEKLEKALIREIKEETNLDIFDINFFKYYESINNLEFNRKKHFIFMDFVCKTKSEKVILNEEATNYTWVTLENALNQNLANTTRQLIKDYLNLPSLQTQANK